MLVQEILTLPLTEFAFMRRALVGCAAVSVGSAPLGVFLVLRRMSLMGDAMAHAILPGAAIGFLMAGLSVFAMTLGGLVAGPAVALAAGLVSQLTQQREDASFAAFYLISLAVGVLIVSTKGSNIDLLHVLFGTVLAIDNSALFLLASIATATLLFLATAYRALVVECLDPSFLRTVGGHGPLVHMFFLAAVVLNLVGGFHALGTLMVVGIMMLPAASARFWSRQTAGLILIAVCFALVSSAIDLLLSYHANLPSGPAIILTAGLIYGVSVLVGSQDSFLVRARRRPHYVN